jgi:hypothetical protein
MGHLEELPSYALIRTRNSTTSKIYLIFYHGLCISISTTAAAAATITTAIIALTIKQSLSNHT